jgi:hypothetical protein
LNDIILGSRKPQRFSTQTGKGLNDITLGSRKPRIGGGASAKSLWGKAKAASPITANLAEKQASKDSAAAGKKKGGKTSPKMLLDKKGRPELPEETRARELEKLICCNSRKNISSICSRFLLYQEGRMDNY